ncbi:hypothetical protein [Pantoea cypripedii]|uniref:DUF4238 domain-containing protein n=1 Tax=Pantoea cypripedii TaxID=55209 RepID=A0A6B9GAF6_PANCY|nr:hypothetical protein [Pantoea cypripedii]QGY30069.1 hypothetical protein CUN67_14485 [Pantoea cypripedii]
MIGICKLCLEVRELQQSHIIPRSYFKNLKKEDGKIVVLEEGKKSITGNFDPKEPMLCRACEQFLSINYEHYGIRVLRDHKNFRKNSNHIVISSFDYKRFYLFLISILWRASVAKHIHYDNVHGSEEIDDILRLCIYQNDINLDKRYGLKLDHFMRMSIFRIVDSTQSIKDEVIKVLLSNIIQKNVDSSGGVMWYFMVEGFIVFYHLSVGKDLHEIRTLRFHSQLKKGSHQKIMKLEITKSEILIELFRSMIEAARQDD